jgi:hypothetical protein
MCKGTLVKLYLFTLVFFCPIAAKANIDIVQQLSFGKLAIVSNASVSTTTMRRNGTQLSTNKILIVEQGRPALIQLTDFPIYTTMTLTANTPVTSSMAYGGAEQFTVTALEMASTIKTDNLGQANFLVGGTLATSGNGGSYFNNATYDIYIDIELSY